MSIRIMSLVWASERYEDPSTVLTLLALADWANDDGEAWPSVPQLAKKARQSERNIYNIINKLIEDGTLERSSHPGRKHKNQYTINLKSFHGFPDEKVKSFQGLDDENLQMAHGKGENSDKTLYIDARADPPVLDPSERKEESNTTSGNADFSGDKYLTPTGLILLYNELTPQKHPKVKKESQGRLAKAKQYLQQWPEREFWEKVFGAVNYSAFLRGEKNTLGHDKFIGDFDWFLQKGKRDGVENCLKAYEGKYHDETNTDGTPRSTPSDLAQRFRANLQGGQRNV